jgi:fatty-acyl-CoA synthase/cyclohexanecarboxylate-CoA ligase/acyl-CoA synthetase
VILEDPGETLTLDALVDFLADRITEVKIPKDLLVLERFPETPRGKLDRAAIAEALQSKK